MHKSRRQLRVFYYERNGYVLSEKKLDKEYKFIKQIFDTPKQKLLLYYRARFQIEFCFRDVNGYTGIMDCQVCDKWKLDFVFNA